jgi:hypothetical protein
MDVFGQGDVMVFGLMGTVHVSDATGSVNFHLTVMIGFSAWGGVECAGVGKRCDRQKVHYRRVLAVTPNMTEKSQITWVTTGQAAAIRGVIPRTIGAYADRGYIRSYRLPSGHRRVCLEDVLAITDNTKAAAR